MLGSLQQVPQMGAQVGGQCGFGLAQMLLMVWLRGLRAVRQRVWGWALGTVWGR